MVFAGDGTAGLVGGKVSVENIHARGGQIGAPGGVLNDDGHGDLRIVIRGEANEDAVFGLVAAQLGGAGLGAGTDRMNRSKISRTFQAEQRRGLLRMRTARTPRKMV